MLRGAHIDAPGGHLQIARVEALVEQDADALMANDPATVFRKERMVLEVALNFRLCLETARREAFKCFRHDGCDRLVTDEHLAAS